MGYGNSIAGRIESEGSDAGSFLSYDDVQQRLVDAQLALWRIEGGRWPFAGDGPWHLVARDLYGPDVDKDVPIRPMPLSRAEVAATEEALAWIATVGERDRRLVVLAVRELAKGRKRVPWVDLLTKMGMARGAGGLARRYERAMSALTMRVNALADARKAVEIRT